MHDQLREWVRLDIERHRSPSEAILDSQSVKSAACTNRSALMLARKSACRKRFASVDTLGLVLRVLVTAANVGERSGGKQVLNRVKQMDKSVSRLHTVWVDAGFDGAPFLRARHGLLPLDCPGRPASRADSRLRPAQKARLSWSGLLAGS